MKLNFTLLFIALLSLCHQFKVNAQYNWVPTGIPTASSRYDDMAWLSPEVGYVIDFAGTLQKTTDGGQSWTTLQGPEGKWYRSIAFMTDQVGFIGRLNSSFSNSLATIKFPKEVCAAGLFFCAFTARNKY